MAQHAADERPSIVIDGRRWWDGEIGIDADGNEAKLRRSPYFTGIAAGKTPEEIERGHWLWEFFGTEIDKLIDETDGDAPKPPITKMRLEPSTTGFES